MIIGTLALSFTISKIWQIFRWKNAIFPTLYMYSTPNWKMFLVHRILHFCTQRASTLLQKKSPIRPNAEPRYITDLRTDRRTMSSCQMSILNSNHVSICSGLAAILNAKLQPAAITHARGRTVSYVNVDCSVRYSNVTRGCMDR